MACSLNYPLFNAEKSISQRLATDSRRGIFKNCGYKGTVFI